MTPRSDPAGRVVPAAGGVLWRPGQDGGPPEFAVVHRPRYDDWSLPKGKLDRGECGLTGAVREVREETGLDVTVGRRGRRTSYSVPEGVKRVDYWVMRADGRFAANDEVDELRWLSPAAAAGLVTHEHDRDVLAEAQRDDVPLMPGLVLVRHGKAGSRSEWAGPDDERPLDRRGRAQAARLAEVLPAFGPVEVLTAPPLRCRQTVQPLAERLGLEVRPAPELGEEGFADDPGAGLALLERLLEPRPDGGVAVVSSQGGAIPSALLHLGVRWEGHGPAAGRLFPPAAKGSCWVLGGRAGSLFADYYRDLDPDPDAPR